MLNACHVLSAMAACDSRLAGAFRQLKRGQAIFEKDGTVERRVEAIGALSNMLTVEAADEEEEARVVVSLRNQVYDSQLAKCLPSPGDDGAADAELSDETKARRTLD